MSQLVFLDRDGVINEDHGEYVVSPEAWCPIAGSLEAIARLTAAGWDVVVVTNQSSIARGLLDEPTLAAIHVTMRNAVEACGGRLTAVLHCPHHPDAGCACRKPEPGLIHEAERRLGRSARGAPFIGDKPSDVEAARRAGCRPVLVRTGHGAGRDAEAAARQHGVPVYDDLAQAVDALLAEALH